jgi:hypothetical protein
MPNTIVHCIADTKAILTNEQNNPAGEICDVEGNHLQRDMMHKQRDIYLDSMSGLMMMLLTADEVIAKNKAGETIYQGVGDVRGWFVAAPDFTVHGHMGSDAEAEAEPEPVAVPARKSVPRKGIKKPGRKVN